MKYLSLPATKFCLVCLAAGLLVKPVMLGFTLLVLWVGRVCGVPNCSP